MCSMVNNVINTAVINLKQPKTQKQLKNEKLKQ